MTDVVRGRNDMSESSASRCSENGDLEVCYNTTYIQYARKEKIYLCDATCFLPLILFLFYSSSLRLTFRLDLSFTCLVFFFSSAP